MLILDEPTAGLDQVARKEYWTTMLQYKRDFAGSIVFSSHLMDEVEENADYVYVLDKGIVVAEGSPQDMIAELGLDYVASLDPDLLQQFDSFRGRKVFVSDGIATVFVSGASDFFDQYGSIEDLIDQGIVFRYPNMTDVYATFNEDVQ